MRNNRDIRRNIKNRDCNPTYNTIISFRFLRKANSSFGGIITDKQIGGEIVSSAHQDGRKQD